MTLYWPPGSRSQAKQDQFVWTVLSGKTHGTWLELGAGHPVNGNNTYYLEQHFNWSGISIDIQDLTEIWSDTRDTCLTVADAYDFDYSVIPEYCDYLQVDLDTGEHSLEILSQLISRHRFSVITFEHDAYADNQHARSHSRNLLTQAGYQCVVADVTLYPVMIPEHLLSLYPNAIFAFEDWWIHPGIVPASALEPFRHLGPGPNYINDIFRIHSQL